MAAVTRRIQLTGGSTYIISIPGKWVKENGLDRGSEVSVEEVNGNLVVSARGGQKTRERNRRINITKAMDRDLLQRVLTAAYIAGFDTLVVRSNQYISQEMREDIKRFAKVVMGGVEIFEEGANSIVLQNVLDSSTFPP
ncbi:AbrB/MazE/SpoVT family DNA-binding domain-containing protein [Thermogymnomonas acidicola]|uniref:AbrB/MazE/SpoVT family DNA-binding domain-containing protein n=1 Tax=Thermogymnomonas acidicola TaxID=399579 RepID=UPI0013967C3C|nr:AbrB/MazE/SpoVT family DNA-binding domain-containing protein [Thermogymnomonas acidicola]